MEFRQVVFSGHAIRRMFERKIGKDEVMAVLSSGKVILEYPDDKPFPSFVKLGKMADRSLHIVAAVDNASKICHIITVYEPDPSQWDGEMQSRRRK